jgi:REP element-mobilizing transposase RayT
LVEGGSSALVTPQNWLFLGSYSKLRKSLLSELTWNWLARLGAGAFETIGGEVVNVVLISITRLPPADSHVMWGINASVAETPSEKDNLLCEAQPLLVRQKGQLAVKDCVLTFEEPSELPLLERYAIALNGSHGGDSLRFRFCFWEIPSPAVDWRLFQGTVEHTAYYAGREHIFYWGRDGRVHYENPNAYIKGEKAWGRRGVVVCMMGNLPVTLYTGELFDISCTPIVPVDEAHLPAIWAFCSSEEYAVAVRKIDQALKVTNATLAKVPFDLAHWQRVAAEKYPNGLPEPFSNDPTQWLFAGHPVDCGATVPVAGQKSKPEACTTLQVGVARLLGYRWPRQTGQTVSGAPPVPEDGLEKFMDEDGIVCIPSVRGEAPAAERLRALLATAYEVVQPSRLRLPASSGTPATGTVAPLSTFADILQQTTYFNPYEPIEITERNLPHWRQPNVTYFITFRLADALPAEKLAGLKSERETWLKAYPEPYGERDQQEYYRLFSQRIQDWLDAGSGSCLLRDEHAAEIVANALRHFDGQRYTLGSWVVMPNHVHAVVTPNGGCFLDQILHSWKSFTAHEINKRLNRKGPVWQHEGYDHIVRNPRALWKIEQYIGENPSKAGIKTKWVDLRLPSQSGATVPVAATEKSKPEACTTFQDWLDKQLAIVDYAGSNLEDWLRNGFFDQHSKLFHQRPFIWQIWDGRKDGFSALVNYHKLDHKLLEKLTYTYLGEWIKKQQEAIANEESGADDRLLKAQQLQDKLKLILEGEAPYDIFVRWKPLEQQPIGWHPDLNDGVRLNIRPFMEADVLRKRPNIKWGIDRGKNPPGSSWGEERGNDRHLTLAEKRGARGF